MKSALIYVVNIILVSLIIKRVLVIDDDKAHLIFQFFYPALLVLNFFVGLSLKLLKNMAYKTYWRVCVWMACLFVPVYIILILTS